MRWGDQRETPLRAMTGRHESNTPRNAGADSRCDGTGPLDGTAMTEGLCRRPANVYFRAACWFFSRRWLMISSASRVGTWA